MNINTNTGGPAFPRAPFEYIDNGSGLDWAVREQPGMTLRDYFAAKALQSAFSEGTFTFTLEDYRHLSKVAYAMADAMLTERILKNDQD